MPTHRRWGRQPIRCRRSALGDLRRSANRTPRMTRPGTGRTQRAPATRDEPEGHGWTHRPGRRGARPEKPWPTEGSTSAEDRQVGVAPTQPDRAGRARGSTWWSPRSHPSFAAEAGRSERRLLPLYCPKADLRHRLDGVVDPSARSRVGRAGSRSLRSWRFRGPLITLAETGGFEPPGEFHPSNRLAGGCFRPLSHVSAHHPSEALAR